MSINYITNNFGHTATNTQYAKYMELERARGRLYRDLYQTVAEMVDGDIYIVEQITEQYRLADMDDMMLIDAIANASDNEYIIDINSDIVKQFNTLQAQYCEQVIKIAQFRQNIQ